MSPHDLPLAADRVRLAATARSILSCPAAVHLVVDGVDDVLAGMDELPMQDLAGVPTFSCLPETDLARAARRRASALLTLESGVGAVGSPGRAATLTLAGSLRREGVEDCTCCSGTRDVVTLEVTFALLSRGGGPRTDGQERVPLEDFRSPAHHLNRGFLQRSVEHANQCHQEELRQAVATTTGTRLTQVVGVVLTDLHPHGVEVRWVDTAGAHARLLAFPRTATDTEELGELLRAELHAGLC